MKAFGLRVLSFFTPFIKKTTTMASIAGLEKEGYTITKK